MPDVDNPQVSKQDSPLVVDPSYVPMTPQSYKQREKTAIGQDNQDTRFISRAEKTYLLGQSADTALGNTIYNAGMMQNVVDIRQLSGAQGFPSKTDRVYATDPALTTGSPLATKKDIMEFVDKNPAKPIEQDAGDVNQFVYMKGAIDKDSPVYFDLKTPLRDKDYFNPNQTVGHNTWFAKHQTDWGFKPPTIDIDNRIERAAKTQGVPYCRIIEDRVGTAAYGYGEEMKGSFSTDVIMIEVLQNISGLRISGSRQEFTPVEPRGSQRPLYFYNKNTGRTLEFTASFHQQEYPLEPLYSIAEKAQYLLRPYRHGDYGLIPKTVRVEIPGRVFRCYCVGAEATFGGEDYRGWSELGLNESNIGSIGNGIAYTGIPVRIEQQTNRIYNSDPYSVNMARDFSGAYFTSKDYRYGLSTVDIGFQFNILEEIKLTTYETQAEIVLREEQSKEEVRQKNREQAVEKAQQYIDEARKNGIQVDFTAEQLVVVNAEGDVEAILINENGEITPVGEATTLEEYNKKRELERSNSAPPKDVQNAVPPVPRSSLNPVTRDTMLTDLAMEEAKSRPGTDAREIKKELEEKYKNDPSGLYRDYRDKIIGTSTEGKEGVNELNAKFESYSEHLETHGIGNSVTSVDTSVRLPPLLQQLLAIPLNTEDDKVQFGWYLMPSIEDAVVIEVCYLIPTYNGDCSKRKKVRFPKEEEKNEFWYLPFMEEESENYLNSLGYSKMLGSDFENSALFPLMWRAKGRVTGDQYAKILENWGLDGPNPYIEMKDVCDEKNKGRFNIKDANGKLDTKVSEFVLFILKEYRRLLYEAIVKKIDSLNNEAINQALSGVTDDTMKQWISSRKIKCYNDEKSMEKGIIIDNVDTKERNDSKYNKNFFQNYGYYHVSGGNRQYKK